MCKLGFNFLAIIVQFAPCAWQSGFNKAKTRNKVYFLKAKLIHRHQCYIQLYSKQYYTKSCLEHATCDPSGPTMGVRRNFRRGGGGASLEKAPLKTKKAPPRKKL